MKRHQFTTIEEVREAHDLLKSGALVAERKQGFYKIQLYQFLLFILRFTATLILMLLSK